MKALIIFGFVLLALAKTPYPGKLSISGLGSGGYMAVQYQVAHSANVIGAGVFAGGPYYCAMGELLQSITGCGFAPVITDVSKLVTKTEQFEYWNEIDPTSNLKQHRVFLFSGTKDYTVMPGNMVNLLQYYKAFSIPDTQLSVHFDFVAGHGIPALEYGVTCNMTDEPYINKCPMDGAGEMFKFVLNGNTLRRGRFNESNLIKFDQTQFVSDGDALLIGLNTYAFAYIPTNCRNSTTPSGIDPMCHFHIALHDCKQSPAQVGEKFVRYAGYNEWAELNNIVVIYPQAHECCLGHDCFDNERSCFDWWGFSGADYAVKGGVQITTIKNMADYFMSR